MKPFNIFISGSGGVGKSHLIKTIHQSVKKLLQYDYGSPGKPQVLIVAPTAVAIININETTIHSVLGLPYREKFFPLDSNTLAALRNKYAEVELIILDEISIVSKKVFYQMHCRLIEISYLPNLLFPGR